MATSVLLPSVPDAEFRDFMRHWPTGVAIVTTTGAHGPAGCTVNALMSLSVEPPLLLVSLCEDSRTLEAIRGTDLFGASILEAEQGALSERFCHCAPAERFEGTIQQSVSSSSNKNDRAVMAMTRSVEELRQESERSRAQLAATVDQLRTRITDTAEDLRYKVSPQGIKSEVSALVSRKTLGWLDTLKQQATENPMQAIAAGTAVAVPALRLARGFPLPLLMIGAGLALTSKTVRARAADTAAPAMEKAKEMAK